MILFRLFFLLAFPSYQLVMRFPVHSARMPLLFIVQVFTDIAEVIRKLNWFKANL